MPRRFIVDGGHCCGALCTRIYLVTKNGHWKEISVVHNEEKWEEWFDLEAEESDDPEAAKKAKKLEWQTWHDDMIEQFKKLIKQGKMTEEEAKETYMKWVEDNPNPDPEEEAYNVTEEFARHPIRIELPQRVEQER